MTRRFVRRAVIVGIVAGLAVWHMALVGLVDSFQNRPIITDILSLGELLPLAGAVIAGYWAARPLQAGRPGPAHAHPGAPRRRGRRACRPAPCWPSCASSSWSSSRTGC